jgi:STE24 endopeptidase
MPFEAPTVLPVNGLAAVYQPRRSFAAGISITWNLTLAFLFVAGHAARHLYFVLDSFGHSHHLPARLWDVASYLILCFLTFAALNYPLDLYFGYLEERQFGLAKDGVRAWTRDWLAGTAQHGVMFLLGSSLLLMLQVASPHAWLIWASLAFLSLFMLTTHFALSLLPAGLFHLEAIDNKTRQKLESLLTANPIGLPPIVSYSAPHLRDFTGGLIGLGSRQVMLMSRATLAAASDSLLRFVLLHDLGHRRYHHLLLSTLAGWAWVVLGLCISHAVILHYAAATVGLPPYIAWLALCLSLWMALGEPLLAYLGRRLEYQADRFYLRQGGSIAEMTTALEELSHRNLARTDDVRRRHTMFHPLPSIPNRLHAAKRFVEQHPEAR